MNFNEIYENALYRIEHLIVSDFNPSILKQYISKNRYLWHDNNSISISPIKRSESSGNYNQNTKSNININTNENNNIDNFYTSHNNTPKQLNKIATRKKYVDWTALKQHEQNYTKLRKIRFVQNEIINTTNSSINNKRNISNDISRNHNNNILVNNNTTSNSNNLSKAKEFSKIVKDINQRKYSLNKNKIPFIPKSSNNSQNKNKIPKRKEDYQKFLKKKIQIEVDNNIINIDIRKPLEKKPNYLEELKLKRGSYDPNRKNKDTNIKSFNDIYNLKYQADMFDLKAKRQTQLININKGNYNIEANEKVTNYLCDSIQTKLAILNNIETY
jgi:hypothetical protein